MPGSMISSTIKSKALDSISRRPSMPLAAKLTTKPASLKPCFRKLAVFTSSSRMSSFISLPEPPFYMGTKMAVRLLFYTTRYLNTFE